MDYDYLGTRAVVSRDYLEPDARWHLYEGATSGDPYPDLDKYGRVTSSRWTSYKNSGTRDFYDVDLTYDDSAVVLTADDNSNVLMAKDNVHAGFDVVYGVDDLNRVNDAEEGTLSGSSIGTGTRTRHQIWTLDQVGAFTNVKLDLDGNDNWSGTGEYNDNRTFSLRNELKTRSGPSSATVLHDKDGHLTDDGTYEYSYDVFGRLVQVDSKNEPSLVAKYRYNGLGHRIAWQYDTTRSGGGDPDGTVDSNDPWFYFVYDDGWRIIATYRGADSNPKERFFYHGAGLGGYGGSSYIDAVILRDRDDNTNWYDAADGTMEQRRYYFQNWRGDVSAILDDGGSMDEWVKYSLYGVPFGLPAGDTDSNGVFDAADATNILASGYDVRKDVELDGDNDFNDANNATVETLGYGRLSGIDSRKGYAGYEQAIELNGAKHHVRHRHRPPLRRCSRPTRPLSPLSAMA